MSDTRSQPGSGADLMIDSGSGAILVAARDSSGTFVKRSTPWADLFFDSATGALLVTGISGGGSTDRVAIIQASNGDLPANVGGADGDMCITGGYGVGSQLYTWHEGQWWQQTFDRANNADYADTAGSAGTASYADSAGSVESAASADYATDAGHASSADTATSADNGMDYGYVDGAISDLNGIYATFDTAQGYADTAEDNAKSYADSVLGGALANVMVSGIDPDYLYVTGVSVGEGQVEVPYYHEGCGLELKQATPTSGSNLMYVDEDNSPAFKSWTNLKLVTVNMASGDVTEGSMSFDDDGRLCFTQGGFSQPLTGQFRNGGCQLGGFTRGGAAMPYPMTDEQAKAHWDDLNAGDSYGFMYWSTTSGKMCVCDGTDTGNIHPLY